MRTTLVLIAIALAALIGHSDGAGVVICQYASWAVYRPGAGKFGPNALDPTLCTHGVYVTAGLDPTDKLVSLDPWADLQTGGGMGGYKKFTDLKNTNPAFKPILALGAWANANWQFGQIAASATRRAALATNAVTFLKQYGFVGLEVDWLYPVTVNEKNNYPLLLAALRSAFDAEGFELMATMGALESSIEQSYDLPAIVPSLDYFLLLGYDYEGSWNPWTGHSAPLYLDNSTLCVDATVQAYLAGNVPAAQLVMGFPGFGRTYTLEDSALHAVGDPSLGPGDAGPYTQTPGILGYNEIAEDASGWTIERDPLSQAPYAYQGNQWLSMDDAISAKLKGEYCVSLGLAGAAIWTVDEDYFTAGEFTLTRAISEGLGNSRR